VPRRRLIRPTTTGAGRLRFASLLRDCCVSCSCHRLTAPHRTEVCAVPSHAHAPPNSSAILRFQQFGLQSSDLLQRTAPFLPASVRFFPGCPLISFRLFSPADWNGEDNFAGIPIEPRVSLSFRIDQPPVTSTALTAREFATAYSHVFPLQIHTIFFFFSACSCIISTEFHYIDTCVIIILKKMKMCYL